MPIVGYNGIGANPQGMSGNGIRLNKVTFPEQGKVTKLTSYITGAVGLGVRAVIYNDSSNSPGTLLVTGPEVIPVSDGWIDLPAPCSVSSLSYWIGHWNDAGGGRFVWNDSDAAFDRWVNNATTYSSTGDCPNNPFSGSLLDQKKLSLYATYDTRQLVPIIAGSSMARW